jgi:hypothetical protein
MIANRWTVIFFAVMCLLLWFAMHIGNCFEVYDQSGTTRLYAVEVDDTSWYDSVYKSYRVKNNYQIIEFKNNGKMWRKWVLPPPDGHVGFGARLTDSVLINIDTLWRPAETPATKELDSLTGIINKKTPRKWYYPIWYFIFTNDSIYKFKCNIDGYYLTYDTLPTGKIRWQYRVFPKDGQPFYCDSIEVVK